MTNRYKLYYQNQLKPTSHYKDGLQLMLDDDGLEHWLPCFNKALSGYAQLAWDDEPPTKLILGALLVSSSSYEEFMAKQKVLKSAEFVKTSNGVQLHVTYHDGSSVIEVKDGLDVSRFASPANAAALTAVSSQFLVKALQDSDRFSGNVRMQDLMDVLYEIYGGFCTIKVLNREGHYFNIKIKAQGFVPLEYNLYIGDRVECVETNPVVHMSDAGLIEAITPDPTRDYSAAEYLRFTHQWRSAITLGLLPLHPYSIELTGDRLEIDIRSIKYKIIIRLTKARLELVYRGHYK